MSRQSYPANYTQWEDPDIQALKAKVLKNETKDPDFEEGGKRLIKALAYKAVHVTELEKVQQMLSVQLILLVAIPACSASARKTFSLYAKEEKLYNFYQELWTEYLTDVVAPATAAPETNSEKLVELSRRYKHFMILLKTTWSKQNFSYLDRYYTKNKNLPTTLLVGTKSDAKLFSKAKSLVSRKLCST